MLDMRLRLPELMAERGLPTAYALQKASKGRLPISTANRLVAANGRPKRVDIDTLGILCDVLGVKPWHLFSGDDPNEVAPDVKRARKR